MNNTVFWTALYRWYDSSHRELPWRDTQDAYRIWLSEIILQQTRVQQGMEYYMHITQRWPSVDDLAAAEEDEVLREWQGLGYYSRARNMHKAAQKIVAQGWQPFPTRFEDIRSLPGVGDYTAGAIASFAYNAPYPAMDGNVYRVVARLTDTDTAFDTTTGKKLFHSLIEELMDHENARLFNSAIMEFGALYCTPILEEAACADCPVGSFCKAHQNGTAHLLPVRKARPQLRDRYLNYRIYLSEEQGRIWTLLHQRQEKDIWQHLWEFPLEESDELQTAEPGVRTMDFKHILSHQRLHARFLIYIVNRLPRIEETVAIPLELLDDYALSRLTLKALEQLQLR